MKLICQLVILGWMFFVMGLHIKGAKSFVEVLGPCFAVLLILAVLLGAGAFSEVLTAWGR